jgi:CrcB protein
LKPRQSFIDEMRTRLLHLSAVAAFAMAGELLRALLSLLTAPLSGVPFPDLAANAVGCFAMGAVASCRTRLLQSARVLVRVEAREALVVGLSSGFCGSLTTFSGWSQSASALLLDGHVSHWAVVWLVGWATAVAAFRAGEHVGAALGGPVETPVVPDEAPRSLLVPPLLALLFFAAFFGVLVATLAGRAADVLLAALLAPLGAVLRCALGWQNRRCRRFPVGTFAANLSGTALLAVLAGVFGRRPFVAEIGAQWENVGASMLPIVGVGFCGSLTTVSSLVQEAIVMLPLRDAYVYVAVTVVASHAVGTAVGALFA